MTFTLGHVLGFAGAGVAMIFTGIGSSIAVARAGQSLAGACSEKPEGFAKLFLLQLLPATQGLYGFIIAFLILLNMGAIGGGLVEVTTEQGYGYLVGALPIAIVGLFSALYQGKIASSSIQFASKHPNKLGNAIAMTAVVETYAIFALIVSFFVTFLAI